MNTKTIKFCLMIVLSLSLIAIACNLTSVLDIDTRTAGNPGFCEGALHLTSYAIVCPSTEPPITNMINGVISNLKDEDVLEAYITMTIVRDETAITCPIHITNLYAGDSTLFDCTFSNQECLSDLKIDESSMTSEATCQTGDLVSVAQKTLAQTEQISGTPMNQGIESIDEAIEPSTPDLLPKEGILTGSLEQQYENNCRATKDIEVDLSKRSYAYSLFGGCDWDDFTVTNKADGGGVVYDDGWFEGQHSLVSTRTCKPNKVCQEDWLKGEQSTRSLVGYIDIPASLISICEYLPDAGAGAGWDLSTFKQFAQDRGEFICPTDADIFEISLTP